MTVLLPHLTVPVIPYPSYKRLRRSAAKEIRLNANDIDKSVIPTKGILFLDHVPKPINLFSTHREELEEIFTLRGK